MTSKKRPSRITSTPSTAPRTGNPAKTGPLKTPAGRPETRTPPPAFPGPGGGKKGNSNPANSVPGRGPSPRLSPPPGKGLTVWLIAAGVGVVLIAAALLLWISGSNSGKPVSPGQTVSPAVSGDLPNSSQGGISIAPDPAARVETFANQGQQHINPGDSHIPYNSDPPTSGPHYTSPLPWGFYDKPQVDENLVHNLEHGGIIIQYICNGNCTEVVNQLKNYSRRYPVESFSGILVAPRPNLPNGAKITLTAWTRRLLLQSFDTQKINSFIADYFNKAPESAG